ncbi:MAG TPA: hypothetical protein VGG40_10285 [Solirubrobacterales bacterium]
MRTGSGIGPFGRRLATVAALCFALAALTAAPALAAKPQAKKHPAKPNIAGRLDPTFGEGGKVTVAFPAEGGSEGEIKYNLPYQFTAGHLEMAAAPGGKVVVAGATKIVRFLANGRLDPSFGNGGEVRVPRPAGMNFVLAAVAVDNQGRVLLAGSARPMPVNSTPDPVISSAMIMRFTAAGAPDPSFGKEGVVQTDFGFAPPKAAAGKPYPGPAVGIRSMVVDSQGRPIVSGGHVSELSDCRELGSLSTAFVARLTEAGALDSTFGEGGVRTVTNVASFGQLGATPAGGLLTLGNGGGYCNSEHEGNRGLKLASLSSAGNLEAGFGFSGFKAVSGVKAPVVAIAPSGKILLLGQPERVRRGKKSDKEQPLVRLLPNGAFDPSFGRIGQIGVLLPPDGSFSALAVDATGRIVLAGRRAKRVSKSPHNPLRRSTFWIGRLTERGTFDRKFGKEGLVTTGFGGPSNTFATQVVMLSKGRMLVGGGISSPQLATGGGFAIAKYLR